MDAAATAEARHQQAAEGMVIRPPTASRTAKGLGAADEAEGVPHENRDWRTAGGL